MLGAGLLFFHLAVLSQQVAKKISYAGSPDGVIGFLEFKPTDYGSQKHPLIIFLHGVGERGNGTTQIGTVAYNAIPLYCARGASMRFTVNGQTSSFVVISPQLSSAYGYWPTYYVKEMIKYAKANLQIDPNRIYVTGLSLGGGGVWRLITDSENFDYSFDSQLAAVAPICGTQEETDGNYCSTVGANNLPVWAHHSMDDSQVGVGATQHAEMLSKNCGVSPAFKATYYQYGGHGGAWLNAYDTGHITTTVNVNGAQVSYTATPNLYEWFLSNTRSAVAPAYTPPVAYAGIAQTITLPANAVNLSGSGSGTNGATINTYSWSQLSGPPGARFSLPAASATQVTGLSQGTYVFALTVTDNHGLSSISGVTVTVNPSGVNQLPSVNAGYDMNIVWPANSVTLNGTASDPDGYITSYSWSVLSGPAGYNIQNSSAASTVISNLSAGKYVFSLKVTDNTGAVATSNMNVNVNMPPVVNVVSNISVTLPVNSVTLDGNASTDTDGAITGWEWSKTSGPASYSIVSPYAGITSANNLVQGTYVFTLKVADNAQGISYASVTVTVNPEPVGSAGNPPPAPSNQPPVSQAGPDAVITLPVNSVALDAGASYDPDGKIVEYYWMQASGPSSSAIANNFSAATTASNLTEGEYIFVLQVKDNSGLLAYSTKTVKVQATPAAAVNKPPVANAGGNVTVTLPVSVVTLDAGGSYDADGRITEYYWTQVSGPSSAPIDNHFSAAATASNLVQGEYVFVLQVKDNNGIVAYDVKTVKVQEATGGTANPGTLLGYIKISTGPYQACDDPSSDNRMPVYGTGIANGNFVYSDAALTRPYDGGWNWYSFVPTPGSPVAYAFAIYPNGAIALLRNCSTGARMIAGGNTTTAEDIAILQRLKMAAETAVTGRPEKSFNVYPNPVRSGAVIEFVSADNSVKVVQVYNANGIVLAKYIWNVTKGKNVFQFKNAAILSPGFYIADIRNANGTAAGSFKFLKTP